MSERKTRVVLDDFSGGRNGRDTPLGPYFADNQVVDAVNVDWYRTTGARKRWGSSLLNMSGSTITGFIGWMGRHVPGVLDRDAEFWICGEKTGAPGVGYFNRLDNSTTWTQPSSTIDAPIDVVNITSASLNGLFFISYYSGVNRLHCYDPVSDIIRRTGIDPGAVAPTVAAAGGGTYAPILRYYRVRFVNPSGPYHTNIISEPTPSVAYTPPETAPGSGIGTSFAARVTRPALPAGETATHWFFEGSTDNVTFYRIGGLTVIGTTFGDDNIAPSNYSAFEVSKLSGTYGLQKSYRLIAADQNRLIGWGSWDPWSPYPADKQNRLEISAVIGALDQGDAERVDHTTNYYIDFDELDSGPPMALVGPLWDRFYAFKTRQMFELIPTGSIDQPYRRVKISAELGCVGPHAACRGEDATGSPCLYILTHRGVYRYGLNGFEYLGKGIEDLIQGPTAIMNMNAATVIGHIVFYPGVNQLWVWFAVGSENAPATTLCVLDIAANGGKGGWSRFTGAPAGSAGPIYASEMFSTDIGATMGFRMVPYVSYDSALILKASDPTAIADPDANFRAYVTTRPLQVAGYRVETSDAQLLAPPATNVFLTATMTPDFGLTPTVAGVAALAATGAETRVTRPFRGSALGGAEFIQMTIGDAAAEPNAWSFDRVVIPVQSQEPLT